MTLRLRIRTLKNETFEISISPTNTVSSPLLSTVRASAAAAVELVDSVSFLAKARPAHDATAIWQRRAMAGVEQRPGHGPACSLLLFFRPFFFLS